MRYLPKGSIKGSEPSEGRLGHRGEDFVTPHSLGAFVALSPLERTGGHLQLAASLVKRSPVKGVCGPKGRIVKLR